MEGRHQLHAGADGPAGPPVATIPHDVGAQNHRLRGSSREEQSKHCLGATNERDDRFHRREPYRENIPICLLQASKNLKGVTTETPVRKDSS